MPEKLPRYPVPVIHLGRLAVDVSTKGQGLGKILLLDALRRAASVSDQLGIYAVEVHALNEVARISISNTVLLLCWTISDICT
jgi:GNAT superfamily N-acetyltransferase